MSLAYRALRAINYNAGPRCSISGCHRVGLVHWFNETYWECWFHYGWRSLLIPFEYLVQLVRVELIGDRITNESATDAENI